MLTFTHFQDRGQKAERASAKPPPESVVFLTLTVAVTSVGDEDSPAEEHRTWHLVVSPTHVVSNLTPWSLRVLPEGAWGAAEPLHLSPGSSEPLLCAWPAACASGGRPGSTSTSRQGMGVGLAVQSVDGSTVWQIASPTIMLNKRGKQKCHFGGSGPEVVTARILKNSRARQHLVLFCDSQPAVRVLNNTATPIEVLDPPPLPGIWCVAPGKH